ncbi:LysR family transcriptional regulator [Telmatospirillum sp.]|uniref:LysR family transcriptional regulator n=1 Tax=Telmatospirillum sp. TaxID=2079197 RepID=UPI00283DDA71|nr:LysR family transcriptional regulator [Telmatospirillum sp.]MDR3437124.1 LysR family transcriptional regulator [Telmatospirillum sp.]
MELKHLRAFVALAEDLHFGRAAQRLGIAQPQLSVAIQGLEAILGIRLFERSRRHVALTDAGRLFLPEARATLVQAERARRTALRAARGEIGRIDIGFTGSAPFNTAMPQIISRFRHRWPDVKMSLREMSTNVQFQALHGGTLDIGFVRPGEPAETEGISLRTVLVEPLFAVIPADHRLAEQTSLSVASLAEESFILHPRHIGTGLYDKVMSLCAMAGFPPRVDLEAHQMSTIVGLAAAGLGVSIVPEAMRRVHVDGARFIPLIEAEATMVLAVACRDGDKRPAILHFLDAVASYQS